MIVTNAHVVSTRFQTDAVAVNVAVRGVVHTHAQLLRTRVMANASGRPGPNAPTGDYRRSWTNKVVDRRPGIYSVETGTNKPQGRRLEHGFNGVDSLGRSYNQPPYAHVGPAVDVIEPMFYAAIVAALP